jgi:hypothetical protein
MLESIGQYGPGYRSPTMHDIREPLLERAVNRTAELRERSMRRVVKNMAALSCLMVGRIRATAI